MLCYAHISHLPGWYTFYTFPRHRRVAGAPHTWETPWTPVEEEAAAAAENPRERPAPSEVPRARGTCILKTPDEEEQRRCCGESERTDGAVRSTSRAYTARGGHTY